MSIQKVLIVDDSRVARVMLMKSLPKFGWTIEEAADGSEALKKLQQGSFDLVFLDLTMYDMDGSEVLKRMKKLHIDVPVIVVSADFQQKMREQVIGLGALEFASKPITSEEVEEILDREGLK